MNLEINAYTDNIVTIGAHYQGKTYLMANLIVKQFLKVANMWIWDYHGKFIQYLNPSTSLIKRRVDDLEYGIQFLKPDDKSSDNFDKFCKKVVQNSNLVVVIDEAHNYSTAQKISDEHFELVSNAGNQGVSYIEIFQRPSRVNKSVLENAYHRFCLATDEVNSVTYLRKWIGLAVELFRPFEERSKWARQKYRDRPQLKQYSFVYRNMHSLEAEVYEP